MFEMMAAAAARPVYFREAYAILLAFWRNLGSSSAVLIPLLSVFASHVGAVSLPGQMPTPKYSTNCA